MSHVVEISLSAFTLVTSTVVSFAVSKYTSSSDEKKALHEHLDNIINIAIEHPYLEDQKFTSNWSETSLADTNEDVRLRSIRYENYGIKVFNYLERYGKHHRWMVTDMENDMNVKEWFEVHEKFWNYVSKSPGYCEELCYLMKRYKNN